MGLSEQDYTNFRISVPAEFEAIFSHFYFVRNDTDQPINKTLLPTYQMMLIFSLGEPIFITSNRNTRLQIERCIILGPIKFAFDYLLPVGAEVLVVNFKADAFYRFFGKVSLADKPPVHPDELLGEMCFTDLWFSLKELTLVADKIGRILEFSRPYIKNREPGSDLISDWSNTNCSLNPIKVLAQQTNQTERTIQLKYKKYLGYSAKEVNRYNRFLKAVELVQTLSASSKKIDWHEIVIHCGYYDQSQLIRDFNYYMNISPKLFLKFQQDICHKTPE